MTAARLAAVVVLLSSGCRSAPGTVAVPEPLPPLAGEGLVESTPSREGIDPRALKALMARIARWPDAPLYSLLISRNGRLVLELYTSRLGRDEAHYVMSVTKSFTSAAVGVAIARGLIARAESPLDELLPPELFDGHPERFHAITLREVLGMSALYAPVPPHQWTAEAKANQAGFIAAKNRVAYALRRPLVAQPGHDFFYTDMTPLLAVAAVSYASKKTLLELSREALFEPMGFRNEEWMHQDAAGLDNGAFGLRVRPIDMQKFGVLYLRGGEWNGQLLLPRAWVEQSFTPWVASKPGEPPDYGWAWWSMRFAGHTAHVANGWRGQRIAVLPSLGLVVTMTGDFPDGEERVFRTVVEEFVVPAVHDGLEPDPTGDAELTAAAAELRAGPSRIWPNSEPRMVPSVAPKEGHHPFRPEVR
jgi:CubicO group peptidase (beta-lactamase class C family)